MRAKRTLEFVLADVDEALGVDDGGLVVVHHCGALDYFYQKEQRRTI